MELLLHKNLEGRILSGSESLLRERAWLGDDITLFIESDPYSEYIIFDNVLITKSSVNGLSLKHLASGINTPDASKPVSIVQYIYNSNNQVTYCRETVNSPATRNNVREFNPSYASYRWYSTRRSVCNDAPQMEAFKQTGNASKIRFDLSADVHLVIKPDIVYLPYESEGGGFEIKSANFVLPWELVDDPDKYISDEIELVDSEGFSDVYLSHRSGGPLVFVHRPKYPLTGKSSHSTNSLAVRVLNKFGLSIRPRDVKFPYLAPQVTKMHKIGSSVLTPCDLMTEAAQDKVTASAKA